MRRPRVAGVHIFLGTSSPREQEVPQARGGSRGLRVEGSDLRYPGVSVGAGGLPHKHAEGRLETDPFALQWCHLVDKHNSSPAPQALSEQARQPPSEVMLQY